MSFLSYILIKMGDVYSSLYINGRKKMIIIFMAPFVTIYM